MRITQDKDFFVVIGTYIQPITDCYSCGSLHVIEGWTYRKISEHMGD